MVGKATEQLKKDIATREEEKKRVAVALGQKEANEKDESAGKVNGDPEAGENEASESKTTEVI